MARREQIKQGISGGTTAPNVRRSQIKAALGQGQPRGPGGRSELPGRVPPMRFPQVGSQRPRQNEVLRQPINLGAQLRGRVQSGAITGAQARKTARQRQLLKNAFGPDWRKQVFGQGGAKGISGPFAQREVAAKRREGIERAKRKLY